MDSQAEAEFSEFMLGRWSRLVRLGYGLTGDQGLAEDLAQTALAKAFASWPRVRRAGDPDAYVRRIMLNANSARFRKHRVRELLTGAPPDGTAGTAVDHVRVTLSGGQSLRVPAVRAGGPRFFAFAIPKGARLVRVGLPAPGRPPAGQPALSPRRAARPEVGPGGAAVLGWCHDYPLPSGPPPRR